MKMSQIATSALIASMATAYSGMAHAATAHASHMSCQPVTDSQIAALFDGWNAALASGDPTIVAKRYAADSVLLPTVSNVPRLTPTAKEDYFKVFLQNKPQGKIDSRTIQIGCNNAFDAGLYTFTFADGKQVQARYSYTYSWNGKEWLITSHHSSAMPE